MTNNPLVPNYPASGQVAPGRLVVDRFDYQNHLQGTVYDINGNTIDPRHLADQILLGSNGIPASMVINGNTCTNVEQAIIAINADLNPVIPIASPTQLGVILSAGDLSISMTGVPKVIGLQGFPVSSLSPTIVTTPPVLAWSGTAWTPTTLNASLLSNITFGGDVTGTPSSTKVSAISGTGPVPVNTGLSFQSGSANYARSGSNITLQSGANFFIQNTVQVQSGVINLTSGSQLEVQSTAFVTVESGGTIAIEPGGVLTASGTAAIQVSTAGGLVLEAASDFVQFGTSHTRNIWSLFTPMYMGSGWEWFANSPDLYTTNTSGSYLFFQLSPFHNGATLTQVNIRFFVNGPHTAVPAQLPQLQVYQMSGDGVTASLSTSTIQTYSPAPISGPNWDTGLLYRTLTFNCNQNNVINTGAFTYFAQLTDETGLHAVAGNLYQQYELVFTTINSDQFP
jgi:hypothetical protein